MSLLFSVLTISFMHGAQPDPMSPAPVELPEVKSLSVIKPVLENLLAEAPKDMLRLIQFAQEQIECLKKQALENKIRLTDDSSAQELLLALTNIANRCIKDDIPFICAVESEVPTIPTQQKLKNAFLAHFSRVKELEYNCQINQATCLTLSNSKAVIIGLTLFGDTRYSNAAGHLLFMKLVGSNSDYDKSWGNGFHLQRVFLQSAPIRIQKMYEDVVANTPCITVEPEVLPSEMKSNLAAEFAACKMHISMDGHFLDTEPIFGGPALDNIE
jgi:hypothetical protein